MVPTNSACSIAMSAREDVFWEFRGGGIADAAGRIITIRGGVIRVRVVIIRSGTIIGRSCSVDVGPMGGYAIVGDRATLIRGGDVGRGGGRGHSEDSRRDRRGSSDSTGGNRRGDARRDRGDVSNIKGDVPRDTNWWMPAIVGTWRSTGAMCT